MLCRSLCGVSRGSDTHHGSNIGKLPYLSVLQVAELPRIGVIAKGYVFKNVVGTNFSVAPKLTVDYAAVLSN